jgi:hypothetical protein
VLIDAALILSLEHSSRQREKRTVYQSDLNKNDAPDAEAICEAVRRPSMPFSRFSHAPLGAEGNIGDPSG